MNQGSMNGKGMHSEDSTAKCPANIMHIDLFKQPTNERQQHEQLPYNDDNNSINEHNNNDSNVTLCRTPPQANENANGH